MRDLNPSRGRRARGVVRNDKTGCQANSEFMDPLSGELVNQPKPRGNARRILIASGLAAFVGFALVGCGGGGDATQQPEMTAQSAERAQALGLLDKLPVSWAPSAIVFSANPGSRQDVPITLTTTKALVNAKIVFVPDLRNAVTVTPDTIASLAAGQSAVVTLSFAPAANDTRKLIAGIVLLFDKNATISKPLPVKVSLVAPESINGIVVPPEPPTDLNNATLAGFDANGNGVRDDVERYIALSYPQSARARAALTQYAKTLGDGVLINTSDMQSIAAIEPARRRAQECTTYTLAAPVLTANLSNITPAAQTLEMYDASQKIRVTYLNTSSRLSAYAAYAMKADAIPYSLPMDFDDRLSCLVNPDTLPN